MAKSEILSEELDLINLIHNNALEMAGNIGELEKTEKDLKDAIYEKSFTLSYDAISESLIDILLINAKEACIKSKEFDYLPFVFRLIETITINAHDMVSIKPVDTRGGINVIVDGYVLGNPEEYAQAVKKVRDELQAAKNKNLTTKASPELASRMWAEKIYGVGREGRTVTRRKKVRGKNKDGERTYTETTIDVTEKYVGKYLDTIERRLAYCNGAPFWYLIENGNAPLGSSDYGGDPYPICTPTNFIKNTQEMIARLFKKAYEEYYKIVEKEYYGEVAKEIGVESGEDTPSIASKVKDYYSKKIDEKKITRVGFNKTLERVRIDGNLYESYITTTGTKVRAHGVSGRFIKVTR